MRIIDEYSTGYYPRGQQAEGISLGIYSGVRVGMYAICVNGYVRL